MTEVEIETSQNEVNEESDVGEVDENVSEVIITPTTNKKPKKLSKKQQRLNAIEDFKNGKKAAAGFFVGQVMKLSKGKADPKIVGGLVAKKLSAL